MSFEDLPQSEQEIWYATYGAAAPYIWAQQAGIAPPAGSAFGALDPATQSLFYGTYGQQAPTIWAQQSAQNAAAPGAQTPGLNWGTPWFQPGGVASGNAANLAGTTGTPYSFGVINQGRGLIPINQDYLSFLQQQFGQGNYIPGSGSYLGWQLDQPGLLATIGGTPGMLTTWGSGAAGDPAASGSLAGGPQTPQEWVNGPRLFQWEGNLTGPEAVLANLFGRSDTSSGASTDLMDVPQPYWQELYNQINKGRIQPTARGWQFLQSMKQVTPAQIGGAAPAQAQSVGATASGATSAGGTDPYAQLLAQQAAANAANQAAQLAYQNALLKHYSDQDALAAAQQAWTQTYQQALLTGQYNGKPTLAAQQQQFEQEMAKLQADLAAAGLMGTYQGQQTLAAKQQEFNQKMAQQQFGLAESGVTGTYQGQPTFQAQQARNQTALSLLGMNAQLSGPSNYLTYLRTLSNTPAGLKDIVNSLGGQFNLSALQSTVPGSQFERQSLATMLRDLNQTQPGSTMDASGAALPSGSQWNPRNFGIIAKNPTQLGLTQNLYQESGRDWNTEYSNFLSSLPKYGGPQQGQVRL